MFRKCCIAYESCDLSPVMPTKARVLSTRWVPEPSAGVNALTASGIGHPSTICAGLKDFRPEGIALDWLSRLLSVDSHFIPLYKASHLRFPRLPVELARDDHEDGELAVHPVLRLDRAGLSNVSVLTEVRVIGNPTGPAVALELEVGRLLAGERSAVE